MEREGEPDLLSENHLGEFLPFALQGKSNFRNVHFMLVSKGILGGFFKQRRLKMKPSK